MNTVAIEQDIAYQSDTYQKNIKDYIQTIYRRKYQVLMTSAAILFVAILLAFLLPSVYRSSSTILIEQQEIPQDLVRSTITSFADQRIQLISQHVMISSNLWKVVQKYNLYQKDRKHDPREVIIQKMRSDIHMDTISADVIDPRSGRPVQATIAFQLSYENKSADLAQQVANELTSLFLNENLKTRTEMAAETSVFLSDEGGRLEKTIAQLEVKLAEFKQKNMHKLPELMQMNISLMERVEREAMEVERNIKNLQEQQIYLNAELAQLNPSSTIYSESGERILSSAGRLKILETEYIRAAAFYSPDHPDIIRLKKEIAGLQQDSDRQSDSDEIHKQLLALRAELAEASKKYSPDHPDIIRLEKAISSLEKAADNDASKIVAAISNADNPAYIQLQTQLEASNSELASLRMKREKLTKKLANYESRLTQTPQIEREYRTLSRDYDNAILKYREIKAKLMEAQLAESMEVERKGERFTLIEPPLLPEKPLKPNRKVLLLLGVLFAIAGGISLAFLLDTIDGNIHGRKAVSNIFGESPLAVIPYIQTEQEVEIRNKRIKLVLIVFSIFCVLVVLLTHFLIMPLDTLWYIMLRHLGI